MFICIANSAIGPIMTMVGFFIGLLALVPVIVVESVLLMHLLGTDAKTTFSWCASANFYSTLAGLLLVPLEIFIGFNFGWGIAILCGSCYALTVYVEHRYYRKHWQGPPRDLLKSVYLVNGVTYMPIIVFMVISFMSIQSRDHHRRYRRISCASNLKQIGLALKQYSMDYDDFFPPEDGAKGLNKLVELDYLRDSKIYICPLDDRMSKEDGSLTEDTLSYVYVGGLNETSGANMPIAYDKPSPEKKFGNVLYVDGHVKGYSGIDWMKQAGITGAPYISGGVDDSWPEKELSYF